MYILSILLLSRVCIQGTLQPVPVSKRKTQGKDKAKVKTSVIVIVYEVLTSLRVPAVAHMDCLSMGDIHGVYAINTSPSARARSRHILVLPPWGTPRRYVIVSMRQWLKKRPSRYRSFCTRVRGLHAYV